MLSHEAHVLGPRDGAQDARLLVHILDPLARKKSGAAIGKLKSSTQLLYKLIVEEIEATTL